MATDKIERGGTVPDFTGYDHPVRRLVTNGPIKPHKNLTKIDRTIRTLEIAADDTITISADDYAEFLS